MATLVDNLCLLTGNFGGCEKKAYGLLCVHFKSYRLFSVRPISRWDRSHIDVEGLTQNVAALADGLARYLYNLSSLLGTEGEREGGEGMATLPTVSSEYVSAWLDYLASHSRSPQLLTEDHPLVTGLYQVGLPVVYIGQVWGLGTSTVRCRLWIAYRVVYSTVLQDANCSNSGKFASPILMNILMKQRVYS